jgi:hypothetical protein
MYLLRTYAFSAKHEAVLFFFCLDYYKSKS